MPAWLREVMQEDDVIAFGRRIMQEGRFDEKDLEFFSDESLKEHGVTNALTRVRMRRRISQHFKISKH